MIQRNVRAALSRWRVARALWGAWIKEYDNEAERYSFTHKTTREQHYNKPWGMGTVDLWALPGDKADENLVSLFLRVEVGLTEFLYKQFLHNKRVGNIDHLVQRVQPY